MNDKNSSSKQSDNDTVYEDIVGSITWDCSPITYDKVNKYADEVLKKFEPTEEKEQSKIFINADDFSNVDEIKHCLDDAKPFYEIKLPRKN